MSREITITLTDDEARLIDERVATGEFASANDLLDQVVHKLLHDEYDEAGMLGDLQAEVDAALDDPAPRTGLDETFDELRKHMADVAEAHRAKLAS